MGGGGKSKRKVKKEERKRRIERASGRTEPGPVGKAWEEEGGTRERVRTKREGPAAAGDIRARSAKVEDQERNRAAANGLTTER